MQARLNKRCSQRLQYDKYIPLFQTFFPDRNHYKKKLLNGNILKWPAIISVENNSKVSIKNEFQ